MRFKIDARDTLSLITGPGRIEKVPVRPQGTRITTDSTRVVQHLMPLMYLLLHRHFEIFRLGRRLILSSEELWDAANSMNWLFDAVIERHDDLSGKVSLRW